MLAWACYGFRLCLALILKLKALSFFGHYACKTGEATQWCWFRCNSVHIFEHNKYSKAIITKPLLADEAMERITCLFLLVPSNTKRRHLYNIHAVLFHTMTFTAAYGCFNLNLQTSWPTLILIRPVLTIQWSFKEIINVLHRMPSFV